MTRSVDIACGDATVSEAPRNGSNSSIANGAGVGFPPISAGPPECSAIAEHASVLWLRDDARQLIGCALVLLRSIPALELDGNEAYCASVVLDRHGPSSRHFELLHRAEERLARSAAKTSMIASERADAVSSLDARLRAGFRVVDYRGSAAGRDWPSGARLLMRKSLTHDAEPFVEDEYRERLAEGVARRVAVADVSAVAGAIDEIALELPRLPVTDPAAQGAQADQDAAANARRAQAARAAEALLDAGYVGVGWARDDGGVTDGALVYRRPGLPPTRRPGRLGVFNEYLPLREVVINYDSFVGEITPETAINEIEARNVGKVDAIAQLDEYRAFVDALQREGVRIVRSGAVDANGRFACFARDSAFVVGKTAFIAHMLRRRRQPESKALSHLFRGAPHIDLRRRSGICVEGGDIVIESSNRLIAGIGQRTNEAAVEAFRTALPGVEIIPVRHTHLHLDVIFTIVGEGIALVHEPALPTRFLAWLENEGYELVPCDPGEQATLGCNVIAVDDRRVIASAGNVRTNTALARHVDVIEVDMPNIVRHGGGPRCLACPVRRDQASGAQRLPR